MSQSLPIEVKRMVSKSIRRLNGGRSVRMPESDNKTFDRIVAILGLASMAAVNPWWIRAAIAALVASLLLLPPTKRLFSSVLERRRQAHRLREERMQRESAIPYANTLVRIVRDHFGARGSLRLAVGDLAQHTRGDLKTEAIFRRDVFMAHLEPIEHLPSLVSTGDVATVLSVANNAAERAIEQLDNVLTSCSEPESQARLERVILLANNFMDEYGPLARVVQKDFPEVTLAKYSADRKLVPGRFPHRPPPPLIGEPIQRSALDVFIPSERRKRGE